MWCDATISEEGIENQGLEQGKGKLKYRDKLGNVLTDFFLGEKKSECLNVGRIEF